MSNKTKYKKWQRVFCSYRQLEGFIEDVCYSDPYGVAVKFEEATYHYTHTGSHKLKAEAPCLTIIGEVKESERAEALPSHCVNIARIGVGQQREDVCTGERVLVIRVNPTHVTFATMDEDDGESMGVSKLPINWFVKIFDGEVNG